MSIHECISVTGGAIAVIASETLSESEILLLETEIPLVAARATHAAYVRAVAAGYAVLRVEDGHFVESRAGRADRVVGEAEPRRKVIKGITIQVRRQVIF